MVWFKRMGKKVDGIDTRRAKEVTEHKGSERIDRYIDRWVICRMV